jgi:hypothetical protein
MSSADLKRKLKQQKDFPETLSVRLHRAISWLKCAEENTSNHDLQFIALWVSYNACYAIDEKLESDFTERKQFNEFISKLVSFDHEKRFYNLLWQKYSGPVRLIIENHFLYKPFWDVQRGEKVNWKKQFDKSNEDALRYLSQVEISKLIDVILDRLYMLRNQIMHGGATYKSKVNRAQVRDACNILKLFIPIIIDIMMDNKDEDWGEIYYPVVE